MWVGFQAIVTDRLLGLWSSIYPGMLLMIAACTALALFSGQACNPGKVWWRSRDLLLEIGYFITLQCIAPYLSRGLLIAIATLAMTFASPDEIADYVQNGRGPVSGLPFWWQVAFYLLAADFLMYWTHRLFHGASLWRYHAIHHSAEDVDWSTAFRFHPLNICFHTYLSDAVMLYAGVSPAVLLFMVPFQTAIALFVHANLNWTLGPLKYVMASPVFHRWHHTKPDEGGNTNFAPTFPLWDVLFGTFYMPAGKLPARYGVDDPQFPAGFLGQMAYPFVRPAPASDGDHALAAYPGKSLPRT